MLNIPANPTRLDYIALGGGFDQLTPTLNIKPGKVRDAMNWEQSVAGGYTRIAGYERTDGRTAPSAAGYLAMTLAITGTLAVGNTITGLTSGAAGVVISIEGSVVAYTKATGAFVTGESVQVSGVTVATVADTAGFVDRADWSATQLALAADVYRVDILAVPGSGPIRGVAYFEGVLYAWRDNAGGTALAIYKATASGWALVPMLYELAFTGGSSEYSEGETISQGGVSATVRRVALESGAWTGTAAGRLIVTAPSGGAFASGASAGGGAATLSGDATPITLLPGGRVEADVGNFGPGSRLYGWTA